MQNEYPRKFLYWSSESPQGDVYVSQSNNQIRTIYFNLKNSFSQFLERNLHPSEAYSSLVENSGVKMTPRVYLYLNHIQAKDRDVTVAKISKEAQIVPNLVYVIEQYEVKLINLCKKRDVL